MKSQRLVTATAATTATTTVAAATTATATTAAAATTTAAATATAAATEPAAITAGPTESATAAAAALFTRTSNVDGQVAAIKVGAIHGVDCALGLLRRRHRDEAETAGATGRAVEHKNRFHDRAVCGKRILEAVLRRIERQVPNEQFSTHSV